MSDIEKAMDYARQEAEAQRDIIGKKPSFLLQAVPIESLETPWCVLDSAIKEIFYGRTRQARDHRYSLASDKEPIETKNGAKGGGQNGYGLWVLEVFRNGYIQAIFQIEEMFPPWPKYSLDEAHSLLFESFCDFCFETWCSTGANLEYLFLCKYVNAKGTKFYTGEAFRKYRPAYNREEIQFSDYTREVGKDLKGIPKIWTRELIRVEE